MNCKLSSQDKIIIIGAGIIGLMTALELVEQGIQVEIFEQSQPASEASWAGGGILSPLYPWKYPSAVNQLACTGKASYLGLNEKLKPITGIDFEIQQTGMLILDSEQFDAAQNYAYSSQDVEQVGELLNQTQLQQQHPRLNPKFLQGLFYSQQANIRNPKVLQSLLLYLSQHPLVKIHTHCAIRQFVVKNEQIQAVIDQTGQRHHAAHYVIATGAWTAKFVQQFKIQLDIHPIHGQMILYKTPANWLNSMYMHNTMYMIPRRDGYILCGSSTHDFAFEKAIHPEISQQIIKAATQMIPDLANYPIVKQWAGLRPYSPKGIPKIGRLQPYQNLWVNAGHYRNGLVTAPASAQLLRELLMGQVTTLDPTAYQWG